MLKKSDAIPGVRIQFRSFFKDGGICGVSCDDVTCLPVSMVDGGMEFDTPYAVLPGTQATIVAPPKKKNNINMIELDFGDDQVGYMFWCDVHRNSSKL